MAHMAKFEGFPGNNNALFGLVSYNDPCGWVEDYIVLKPAAIFPLKMGGHIPERIVS